jgi:hypothetical protein
LLFIGGNNLAWMVEQEILNNLIIPNLAMM